MQVSHSLEFHVGSNINMVDEFEPDQTRTRNELVPDLIAVIRSSLSLDTLHT